jgi:hypothetical protein
MNKNHSTRSKKKKDLKNEILVTQKSYGLIPTSGLRNTVGCLIYAGMKIPVSCTRLLERLVFLHLVTERHVWNVTTYFASLPF